MFMRKIKYSSMAASVPFVRFLNEFEAQKRLFSKEGIEFESKHKETELVALTGDFYCSFRNIQGREFG